VHSLQFARCSTVSFRYYLLGGYTVAPSGLYARLCHAFLVLSSFLARSANLPTGLYILLALISFFFLNWAKLSHDLLDRFLRSFHQIEGICVNVDYPVHFFQFLKGRCHGNQFCVVADSLARSQSTSGSAGPIFTTFAPYCRYWIVDDQSDPLFPISWGTLLCQPI